MNGIRLLICAAVLCLAKPAGATESCESPPCDGIPARTFSGKAIAVMDGDTLLVLREGKPVKVRLAEIDAPEKTQPYGAASQKSLAEMVQGEQISVVTTAVDDYRRLVAKVYVGEFNVNHEQVWRGMAWEYSRFHSNRELLALQDEARHARRGLWAGKSPIEPSKWRKQHPATTAGRPPRAAVPPVSASVVSGLAAAPPRSSPEELCGKKRCSELGSCEEAKRYFTRCGLQALDGDADGKPCESLCAPAKGRTGKSQ